MRKVWHYLVHEKDPSLNHPHIKLAGALMMGQGLALIVIGIVKLGVGG
jgi:hypothetical protein